MKKILVIFLLNLLTTSLAAEPESTIKPSEIFAKELEVGQETLATIITPPVAQQQEAHSVRPAYEHIKNQNEEKNIYLNFENATLSSVVNYMAELKKINLIPHKDIENAKVSLSIAEPLTISEAWNVFYTLLEASSFTIVLPEGSEVYRVVNKDSKLKEPLPVYINVPYETLPDSDITIRYVTMLTNITTEMVKDLLGTMLTNPPVEQPIINGFIIRFIIC